MRNLVIFLAAALITSSAICADNNQSAEQTPPPMKKGDELKSIIILEALGSRGTGGIFIGFNSENKEMVSVKTLFSDLAKETIYKRQFKREAITFRKLNHPNIIGYVDSGFDKGRYFIATEFVKGKTLADLVVGGKGLPVGIVLKIMSKVSDGVAHSHDKRILHCDLRPQNIMVTTEGFVKIIDFGNAKKIGAMAFIDPKSCLRNPRYSSPEQNQGQKLDERSDLYCLGLLFFELLTGRRALYGSSLLEITAFQMGSLFPQPSKLNNKISPDLDKLVMKLLEKDPNNRYKSAAALIDDIKAIHQD